MPTPADPTVSATALPDGTRRGFIRALSLGGGALLAGCGRGVHGGGAVLSAAVVPGGGAAPVAPVAPTLPDCLDSASFYVHSGTPLALETRRSRLFSGAVTPASLLFVRNNLPLPSADIVRAPDAWVLDVSGVGRPGGISLATLKGLGRDTVTAVLQCSGNGRAFFEHGPSGSQWSVGAAGCVVWTGVLLSTVVAHLGGSVDGMKYVTATGGEILPQDVDPLDVVVERSIPIDKGMRDCLLAWEMNGQPVPITHGGPLRLIVPGYFGCNQIKYVRAVSLTKDQSRAKIQRKGYRFRPVGEKGDPGQPSLWRMPVKSWVNGPGADGEPVLAGSVQFHGVAFSGERGISAVEVSLDGGQTWSAAELYGPDMGPSAWRSFRYSATLPAGEATVVSRATDTSGDVQPRRRVENERGYRYTAWQEAGLRVSVVDRLPVAPAPDEHADAAPQSSGAQPASSPSAELSERGQRGRAVFTESSQPPCGVCHTLEDAGVSGTVGPNLDALAPSEAQVRNAVSNGVGVMPAFGDSLSGEQIGDLARYVHEATR